jgi:hypothetical protein
MIRTLSPRRFAMEATARDQAHVALELLKPSADVAWNCNTITCRRES